MKKSEGKFAQIEQGEIHCPQLVNAEINTSILQVFLQPTEVTYLFHSNHIYVLALV